MDQQRPIARFADIQNELAALKGAFGETPQQRGGVGALSGFSYQMQTALLALLNAWIDKPRRFQSTVDLAPVLVEALSDYTDLTSTAIVCCQVKRTLGPAMVRRALEEFWLILKIAKQHAPHIVDLLRFRIVHRFNSLRGLVATLSEWTPPDPTSDDDLVLFKQRIEIINTPNPSDHILVILANNFYSNDPLGQMNQWIGSLFNASSRGGDF